jgi:hypothetical protein
MEFTRLREVLAAFADDPGSVIIDKSRIVVQIQGELISATTATRDGSLYITEDDQTQLATRWVADRIAQLGLVADRIAAAFPQNPRFVVPSGVLLDQLEEAPHEESRPVPDAVEAARSFLARRPGGVCSVLYLTSDAGEGKTTTINELARRQAQAYREKKTDWLLLPFTLGGNPFLRLDNVIAANLLNQLRIRRFYLDGLYHLVRLGYIIPALDGFEEVFVETSGEAVSSLGNLISDLRGEGTLLVAARTAYFEFKRMDSQARLFDTIPGFEVGFGRLSLSRWARKEFVSYCNLAGVPNADQLYDNLSNRLGQDHALITRAFFVSRIADLAQTVEGSKFLQEVQPHVQDSFRPFIDRILDREVQLKWIDKYTTPAQPLLTPDEHHELLRLLAEEMWTSKRGSLPRATADDLADLYCESRRKSPSVTRQVKERLPHHALLAADTAGTQVMFDHDHFREFFLGEQLGEYIRLRATSEIRKLIRIDSVPPWTLDSAISLALRFGEVPSKLIQTLSEVACFEGPTSFVRENGGALCVRLAEKVTSSEVAPTIQSMTLPQNGLGGRVLRRVCFLECYFRSTIISGDLRDVEFKKCEFEHIEVEDVFSLAGVILDDCQIHGLTVTKADEAVDFYDPADIQAYLSRSGATIERADQPLLITNEVPEDDDPTKIIRKLLMIFRRVSPASESVIRLRLGVHSSTFFNDMCTELCDIGVLTAVKHRGGGVQRRFRLAQSMAVIADALAESRGSYPDFLRRMRTEAVRRVEDSHS